MVIQIELNNGRETRTAIHRNVKKHELPKWREGFYAHSYTSKWGTLSQLKGTEQIKLASFGGN